MTEQSRLNQDTTLEIQIRLEEIRLLYNNIPFSLLGNFVVSLTMYVSLYTHAASINNLNIWICMMFATLLFRGWDTYQYSRTPADENTGEHWGSRFLVGSTMVGALWGALPWMGYSPENEYQSLIVMCIVGVSGGAMSTLSYRWKTIAFFLVPALGLLEISLVYQNTTFSLIVSALVAVFILFTLSASRRVYINMNQNVRLRIEAASREQALSIMHQRQALHVEQTPLAVIEFNTSLHVTAWNMAAEEIFGYSSDEAISKNIMELVISKKSKKIAEHYWQLLLDMQSINGAVMENTTKDHRNITCEWFITPLTNNDDRLVGIAALALDISDKQQTEKDLHAAKDVAEKASNAKSEFLSSMSHELRTPLNAILGFAQLLEHNNKSSQQQQSYAREIAGAGNLLLELVNQVLDLTRIEEGRIDFNIENISLSEIVNECFSLMTPLTEQRSITINVSNSCKGIIIADYVRLKQVILNLVSNAIKYNKPGGSVTISCKKVVTGTVRMEITDTGTGIPGDQLENLFKPFNRLGYDNSRIEGTGIGLSISKQLIIQMQGKIGMTSNNTNGCTFWLELPGTVIDESVELSTPVVSRKNVLAGSTGASKSARILVAEDNLTNQTLILDQLRTLGYSADVVNDGSEAINMLDEHDYDLVLADCNMPVMDGYELARNIRANGDKDLPIVAITADAFPEKEKKCLDAGMNARIVKPILLESLKNIIEKSLR